MCVRRLANVNRALNEKIHPQTMIHHHDIQGTLTPCSLLFQAKTQSNRFNSCSSWEENHTWNAELFHHFFFGNFMKWRRKTIIQTKTNPLKQMGFNSNCYGFTVWYLFPSCNAWYERPNVLCSLWIYGCLVRSQFTVHRLKLCVCWAWLRQCIATIFSKAGEKNTTFTIKRVKNMCSIARNRSFLVPKLGCDNNNKK